MSMREIVKDSTSQSVVIRIIDSTTGLPETGVEYDTSGIDMWYRREGATKTSITEVALAALDSVWAAGGIEHMGDGYYRLDLPDAAVATGCNGVMVGGAVTDMIVIGCYVPLVDFDPYDSVPEVDLTHVMGTILTETAGGRLAAAIIKLFDVATPLLVASDVMRGTNGSNTTVPDAAGIAAGLHTTTDGKIDGLVVPDAAGTAAALHATTDGKIDSLVVPDAAGTAAALHATTDGKIDGLDDLNAQEVRDAMKLAPTAGAAAAGSVDIHLDTIEADTDELQTNQGNWATAAGFSTPANVTDAQTAIVAEIDANESKIDTAIADIGTVDGKADTIQAKTDTLPSDPADASVIAGRFDTVDTRLTAARAGYLDNLSGHTPQTGDTFAALPANFSDLSIAVTTGRVDVGSIEGADATDQIRDSIVDDATRIDASAINTLSGFAPDNTIADVDDLGVVASETGIEAHVTDALNTYDPPTRAELTSDKDEIIAQVDANETKIDAVDSTVDAIKAVTDFIQKWTDNKIGFSGSAMVLYDDDGVTPLRTWTLSEGTLDVSGPYDRAKAT